MPNTTLTNALAAANAVKEELTILRSAHTTLTNEEKQLRQQKLDLQNAPVPIEDVKQAIFQYIDARGEIFLKDGSWRTSLEAFVRPPRLALGLKTLEGKPRYAPLTFLEAKAVSGGDVDDKVVAQTGRNHARLFSPDVDVMRWTDANYYFFFGDAIKAKIEEYFVKLGIDHDAKDKKVVGSSMADREVEIAAIDTRLQAIVSERSTLDDKINQLINASDVRR